MNVEAWIHRVWQRFALRQVALGDALFGPEAAALSPLSPPIGQWAEGTAEYLLSLPDATLKPPSPQVS
ncbi:MAG: hypothetical protein K6U14_00885 [Firmicutes bacterium]|nr:hypothetical protein [Alicyclobacillaceae bacterium]MCL6496173.1 hypothetical protein [Bacillota bacterium]